MIKRVACLLATALLLMPATSRADGKGEGKTPAPAGGGLTGVYYPPQSPSNPDLDLAPNEMLNRNVRILRTTNKAQLNRYVPVAYAFNNVNPYAVRRFLNRAIESEDGSIFTFVSPDGNSGRLLAMIPEYQIPALDKLVAAIDRAELTSSSGTHRAYVQLKHRRADLSDADFLNNFGIYLTANADRVIIDPEQNAIFIEDAPSGTEWLLAALDEKLDKPSPQVLASVNVYEVDGTNNARLGNDYIAWKNGPGSNLFAVGAFAERGDTDLRSGSSDNANLIAPIPFTGEEFDSDGYNFAFNFEHSSAFFDFLVVEGQAEVLTKAKLAALNTRPARITAGDQILYYAVQTDNEDSFRPLVDDDNDGFPAVFEANQDRTMHGTQNEVTEEELVLANLRGSAAGSDFDVAISSPYITDETLSPVQTGLDIEITPVIFENGVEVDVVGDLETYNGFDSNGFPRINSRAFSTQVRMGAGQEIVLGGLAREETTRATNKPPAIGSIPGLGWLFGQENTRKRKSTLVITLGIDQIVRFDGDQAGKTDAEDSLLKQARGEEPIDAATSRMGMTPGIED